MTARRLLPVVALVAVLAGLAALWVPTDAFGRFRGLAGDPIFPRGELDDGVVLVAIDDASLASVGEGWPWSRTTLARLVEQLDAADAEVVVLDILLSDPRPDDARLADALRAAGNVVLAAAPVDLRSQGGGRPLMTADVLEPVPALADAAAAIGSSLAAPDGADGVVRRSPLVVEDRRGRLLPALALAARAVASRADPVPVLRRGAGVQIGGAAVPTDDRYRLRISWPSGLGERSLSAADVLRGDVDRARLSGRRVYVGATAPSLGDRWSTPLDRTSGTPGVATHVAVDHTVASRQFIGPASTTETVAWMVLLAAALVLATRFLPLWAAALADVAIVVGAITGAYQRSTGGVLVDVVDLAVVPALAIPLAGGLRYLDETRLRRRVSSLFARYVPEPVARELVRQGRVDTATEGQRLTVTVLFCDLRGFTPIAASLSPARVNRLLTAYYEAVSASVLRHGGTIVQYVGDEVFAVFGAPLPTDDHAACALRAADEIQRTWPALRATLEADGLPAVRYGLAAHTGEVVAAHAGSSVRRQYAVIGDTVNVGSRLCGIAGAGEVVVSEACQRAAGAEPEGERFEATLRGIEVPVGAWRIAITAPS